MTTRKICYNLKLNEGYNVTCSEDLNKLLMSQMLKMDIEYYTSNFTYVAG